MNRLCSWVVLACALTPPGGVLAESPARYAGAKEMARKIDGHLEAAWREGKVTPAAEAEEGEWVRRVYLDLVGRIPSVREVRSYLEDKRADRRERLVEKLLDSPRYATHFATVWRNLLLPEANANFQLRFQAPGFEKWLRDWIQSGKGYDWMVKELLTTPIGGGRGALVIGSAASPQPFYAAKEYKPEEIASSAVRLLLGVNLGCAQCHHHPFAEWKREQFWSFAAFFAGMRTERQGEFTVSQPEEPDRHELTIPGTEKVVKATYLDGKRAEIAPGARSREILANWVIARENPYFAKAIVNRMWAHFFGIGLIEPLDEMVGSEVQASHPALLAELAEEFAARKYDLRWLMRTLTATRAYQMTSRRSHASQDDARLFARMPLRGLTPEQLYDSVVMATGYQESGGDRMSTPFQVGGARNEFVSKFANAADRPTEVQTSILQALTLMNGRVISTATDLQSSETLAALTDAPFLDTQAKLEVLYLAALSRKPTVKEQERLSSYVEKGGAEAMADVFWMLLNSSEFIFNH